MSAPQRPQPGQSALVYGRDRRAPQMTTTARGREPIVQQDVDDLALEALARGEPLDWSR